MFVFGVLCVCGMCMVVYMVEDVCVWCVYKCMYVYGVWCVCMVWCMVCVCLYLVSVCVVCVCGTWWVWCMSVCAGLGGKYVDVDNVVKPQSRIKTVDSILICFKSFRIKRSFHVKFTWDPSSH